MLSYKPNEDLAISSRNMHSQSISRRMIISISLLAMILFSFVLAISWNLSKTREFGKMEEALLTRAKAIVSLTEIEAGEIEIEFSDELMPEYDRSFEPYYFQIWERNGKSVKVFKRSLSLKNSDLPLPKTITAKPTYLSDTLENGRKVLVLTMAFTPLIDYEELIPGETIQVIENSFVISLASGIEEFERFKQMFFLLDATPMVLYVFGLMAGIYIFVHRGLKPLTDLADKVATIDVHQLDQSIDLSNLPQEVLPLVERLNMMLVRVKSAIEHEQRFSSDVAHELRTPIAELRLMCEVNSRDKTQEATALSIYNEMLIVLSEMEAVVEILLSMARMDAHTEPMHESQCDLNSIFSQFRRRFDARLKERNLDLTIDIPTDSNYIVTDYQKFELIPGNLIGNMVAYAPEGSQCYVRTSVTDDNTVNIHLSNPALDLQTEDIENMFERFWQKDCSRTVSSRSGLGLPLVKALCQFLGVTATAEIYIDNTLTITIGGFKKA